MHTLYSLRTPIPALYVKSAPHSWMIGAIFSRARSMAPCLLVFEDIDTIVGGSSRSYFFNEVDGLESNDGIMLVATTNHRMPFRSPDARLPFFFFFDLVDSGPTRRWFIQTTLPLRPQVSIQPALPFRANTLLRALAAEGDREPEDKLSRFSLPVNGEYNQRLFFCISQGR
jgi:hypothetical protein